MSRLRPLLALLATLVVATAIAALVAESATATSAVPSRAVTHAYDLVANTRQTRVGRVPSPVDGGALAVARPRPAFALLPGAVLSIVATEGGPTVEGGDTVQLFRHVDPTELQDIQNTGEFGLGPNSTGKYFVESADHAQQWGQMVNNGEGAVVETNVPRSVADQLYSWEKLDGIGPARFVSPEQLDWFNQAMDGIRVVP